MKSRKSKTIIMLSTCLAISLTLFGCGEKKAVNDTVSAESSTDKITLTIGHYDLDKNGELFREALQEFRDENTNINLVEEAVPHDAYRVKMTTLGASGELPDLFVANGSMLIDYIPKGYVGTLNEALDADPTWRDGFLPNSFDEFTVDGNIYGVPTAMFTVHMIYYNKELFQQAGISEFPKTWDGFTEAIEKLKAIGVTPIAMGNKTNVYVGSTIFSTLADRFTGAEWFYDMKAGKAKFTDADFVSALTRLQDLAKLGAFNPDINSIDPSQARTLYFNKKAAMIIDGAWAVTDITRDGPDEIEKVTGLASFPPIPEGKGDPNAVAGGSGWSVAYNAKLTGEKKEAAIKLLKKVSNEDYGRKKIERNGQPAMKVIDYDKSKLAPLAVEYFEFMEGKKFTPIYDIQLNPALVEVIYKGLQDLLIGGIQPADLAKKIQTLQDSQQ